MKWGYIYTNRTNSMKQSLCSHRDRPLTQKIGGLSRIEGIVTDLSMIS